MVTSIIFLVSLVFLGLLLLVKRRELAGGTVYLSSMRLRADVRVVRIAERVELKIELLFHLFSKRVIIKGLHKVTLVALRVVRVVERRLVRVTTLVRGRHESITRRISVTGYLEGITRENKKEEKEGGSK